MRQAFIYVGTSLGPAGTRSKFAPTIQAIQTYKKKTRTTPPTKAHAYMGLNEERGWIPNDLAGISWDDSASLAKPLRLGQNQYIAQITKAATISQVHQCKSMLSLLFQYLYKILRFNWLSIYHTKIQVKGISSTFLNVWLNFFKRLAHLSSSSNLK